MGQTHVPRYMNQLLQHIVAGDIDPSFVITHRLGIDDAADGYRTFRYDPNDCIKVVLNPS
jgi:threonine dehydrogenase-like Zn-dependent dehydrogenase